MTISKTEKMRKRVDPEKSGVYEELPYGKIFLDGKHNPTEARANEAGWMRTAPTVYDKATHTLVPGSYGDDGISVRQSTRLWTSEELIIKQAAAAAEEVLAAFRVQLAEALSNILKGQFYGVSKDKADQFIDLNISDSGTALVMKKVAHNLVDNNLAIEALIKTLTDTSNEI